MALVVEDGTGLAAAEAYGSATELRTYAAAWGVSLGTATDADLEVDLRKATAFVDTFGPYKARRLVAAQALEFPREGLTDDGGHLVLGVPGRVKRATFDLALKVRAGTVLQPDLARGGRVQSQSVGPLSVSYAPDAPAGTAFTLAQKLLEPFLERPGELEDMTGPAWTAPELAPAFSVGMFDSPATAPDPAE